MPPPNQTKASARRLLNPAGPVPTSSSAPFDLVTQFAAASADLPPIAARGLGSEVRVGGGQPPPQPVQPVPPDGAKVKPTVKLSAQSLKAVELSKQLTAKKKELDQEKHLQAQIKELQRQLELAEKRTRLEKSKVREMPKHRRNLIVAMHKLPYEIVDRLAVDGDRAPFVAPTAGSDDVFRGGYSVGSSTSRHSAGSEARWEIVDKRTTLNVLDGLRSLKQFSVTLVGGIDTHAEDEDDLDVLRRMLEERGCVPLFTRAKAPAALSASQAPPTLPEDTLWPLFHYIPLSTLEADFADTQSAQWREYERMNREFADTVSQRVELEAEDLVWVHDYHLMLVPSMLRERWERLRIGWFLHTPFPSSEIYITLPRRKEILRGVLSANLIGFHIYDYVRHFMNSCMRVLATDIAVDHKYVMDSINRQASAVDAFPIGIDPGRYVSTLQTPAVKDLIIDLQRRFDGKRIVLGLDLLDFVKGIPHKLMAYEKFLIDYPQWRGRITLVQIAVPPATEHASIQKLKNKVHKLVGRINGRFGTLEHSPIHYLDQAISFEQQVALTFLADVAMITSLREGMSHTAFEYIACQAKNHGVLILSEFAGAAQALGSGAIMVNPFHTDDMAFAIDAALGMGRREREERHARMLEYVNKFTASWWAENFATEMLTAQRDNTGPFSQLDALAVPEALPVTQLMDRYRTSSRRLLIVGLLGVLINYHAFKNLEPLPDELYHNLAALCADPRNTVVVVTGRERALAQQWLGNLPVWLCAEGGLFYRLGGRAAEWHCAIDLLDQSWMGDVRPVFKYFEQRTPCTFTEVQEYTMTWHYREADEDFGEIQASDLQLHLDKVLGNMPVEVSLDEKQVQVRPYGVSKGAVLECLMEELTTYNSGERQGAADAGRPVTAAEEQAPAAASVAACTAASASSSAATGVAVGADAASSAAGSGGAHAKGAPGGESSPLGLGDAIPEELRVDRAPGGGVSRDPRSIASDLDSVSVAGSQAVAAQRPAAVDFVLCVGDLATRDEDLFSNITATDSPYVDHLPSPESTFTVRVGGNEPTQARFYMPAIKDVEDLVSKMAALSRDAPPSISEAGTLAGLGTPEIRASTGEEDMSTINGAEALNALPSALTLTSDPAHALLPFKGRRIAFFLDYDGTLTPIVTNPMDALMSDSMREIVRSLAALYPTAIVSGRPIATAHGFVKLDDLYYAGNHGMDITGPSNSLIKHQVVDDMYRPALESANAQLTRTLAEVEGVLLEDNTFSLSVHYRAVPSEDGRRKVAEAVDAVLSEMPMLRKMDGKMVYELRPEVEWNKGRAVEWLLDNLREEYEEDGGADIFPIYIGDDVTDEDAFRTLRDKGTINDGIGIIVTDSPAVDGATEATYQLKNPSEVGEFLEWFTRPEQRHLAWQNKKQYTEPPTHRRNASAGTRESALGGSSSSASAINDLRQSGSHSLTPGEMAS